MAYITTQTPLHGVAAIRALGAALVSARSLNAQNSPQNTVTYHTIYDNLESTIYIYIYIIYIYVFKIISTILIPFDAFWGFDRHVVHLELPETSSHTVCPPPVGRWASLAIVKANSCWTCRNSVKPREFFVRESHSRIHVSVCVKYM